VRRLVCLSPDVEVDEHWGPIGSDLWGLEVLEARDPRQPRANIVDRGSEGGRADVQGAVLDEDALTRGLLEPGIEDLVHAAGFPRTGRVRIDLLRSDLAAEGEG